MYLVSEDEFYDTHWTLGNLLLSAPEVDVGEWQSLDIRNKPEMVSHEITNVMLNYRVPFFLNTLQAELLPNLPWAEDHFQERVSGQPLNPPPSEEWWPYAQMNNVEFKKDEKFSHTYPERFWPKYAGEGMQVHFIEGVEEPITVPLLGIRYHYGDLDDVVTQLAKSPLTRQAYLPVWFPEDTGAVHGERVPCTLGYHFMVRNKELSMTYFIRSCDFMRHFRDDLYMAARLMQWVAHQLKSRHRVVTTPGQLVMHIDSLHIFRGDVPILRHQRGQQHRG